MNKLNLRYNTQMEITERIIIEQLKRGNEEAYKYLYRHHYALLCHIAREYVGDDFLAETLVGDVVFHLWEVHETLDIQVSLRSYLVRAVRNHCMDYLSSKKERTEVAFSSIPEEGEMRYLLSDDYPWEVCWNMNWKKKFIMPSGICRKFAGKFLSKVVSRGKNTKKSLQS